jgi:hypothetical protein
MWQDIALMCIGILFGVFLVPVLLDARKGLRMNKITCSTTAAGLYTTALVYSTLDLWVAAASTVVTGTIWLAMLLYSMNRK